MNTYELPISKNYCSSWELSHAFRELIQNGIDQEAIDSENVFSTSYDPDLGVLSFRNKKSVLDIKSLVLGNTTKSNDSRTVGEFGEGYKIAAIVLNRLGKTFTIHNGIKGEEWTSEFRYSEHWDSEILVFSVNEIPADDKFSIDIGNIGYSEHHLGDIWLDKDEIDPSEIVETEYGEIILSDYYESKVFVNGLAINWCGHLKYGYNFKPEHCRLERDRRTCDEFNAKKVTANMLAEAVAVGKIDAGELFELVEKNSEDVYNADICGKRESFDSSVCEAFERKNPDCIPVYTTDSYERVKMLGGEPIVVSFSLYKFMENYSKEKIEELVKKSDCDTLSTKERFERWFAVFGIELSHSGKEEFKKLLEKL